MRKLNTLVVITTLLLGTSSLVQAETKTIGPGQGSSHPVPPPPHEGWKFAPMANFEGIKLTEAQEQQLKAIMDQQFKHPPKAPKEQGAVIDKLITAEKFDRNQAETVAEQIGSHQQKLAMIRIEALHKAFHVLTPAQQRQYQANLEKHQHAKPKPMPAPAAAE